MPPPVRLVLTLHNHQPVGNFDGVFDAACRESYEPFLDALEAAPDVPISLHVSGSLMEWLAEHRLGYIERLRRLIERGQLELLGGAYYEPILTMLPPHDRVGQIRAYREFLEATFRTRVRGAWIAERVWEQCLVTDLARAGIEYTVLDDAHFRFAGLAPEQLHGFYVSEDCGNLLKIFPGSERLRYTIPFADPEETVAHLAQTAQQHPGAVVVFADDGEKFGTWPGTHKHVYHDGWLQRFFDALRAQGDWLQLCTLAEAVDHTPPLGKIYLPAASYREMTEWAMPPQRQLEYEQVLRELPDEPLRSRIKEFLHAGYWRNFKAKYPEADEMYARMLGISRRLEERHNAASNGNSQRQHLDDARRELYRGQCNCAYWHGAFGGLYLPHLRQAVYNHLIAADNALEKAQGRLGPWVDAQSGDFNLDLRQEIRLASDKLVAYLAPARGGMLYELDVRAIRHNLLATLARRPEGYHQKLIDHAAHADDPGSDHAKSIHERIVFKQKDLDQRIQYDRHLRKSFLDHLWPVDTALDDLLAGNAEEQADWLAGVYEARLRRSADRVQLKMTRTAKAAGRELKLTKAVTLEADSSALQVSYLLEELPQDFDFCFAVELNFAGLAPNAPDRFFYSDGDERLGTLETRLDLPNAELLGLVDEWLGLDVAVGFSRPTAVWTFPVETVSNSEGGFELIHQSTAVLPHWRVRPDRHGKWRTEITLAADTSTAEARQPQHAVSA